MKFFNFSSKLFLFPKFCSLDGKSISCIEISSNSVFSKYFTFKSIKYLFSRTPSNGCFQKEIDFFSKEYFTLWTGYLRNSL